ncbi:Cytochrome c oxidase subunit 5B, mitochondrial [Trichinella nelsoni]|uniref:Cytochrome c oxidase subunit 5B, mitochondrial n=3 Tax=Trichinella TaxID=6333 RepID=A0A0V1LNP2_9BILA|nr:Cytochrome c oxidase subunit 5B, mitochondrial [Trichinella nelsoni]KRX49382.1 Cytochrome c oxidase subunit 5B, mitochondrial [Trichinella murrelli]KRX84647.1 Cytochrome c oxidase subunit 5B, mitochondrial [Trichinella sp. T6]KRZ61145.1 Cytochrome c oxidase subunit 5B, mitochondrial [Trichinella nativa]
MLHFILKNHKLRSAYFSKRFNSGIGSIFQDEDVNTAIQKRRLLARILGDDRYEPKIYKQGKGTREEPNIILSSCQKRYIGCLCDANQTEAKYMCLEKGVDKQCACGYWFKLIDDDLNDF